MWRVVWKFRRERGIYVLKSRYEGDRYCMLCNSSPSEYDDDLPRFTEIPMHILELAGNSLESGVFQWRIAFITRVSHIDTLFEARLYFYSVNSLSSSFPYWIITSQQSKNTCAHNNTQKAHANGIKKAKRSRFVSTRGMDPKFLRNQKFAKKYNGSKRVQD
jgi:large subunit ribosomal protein L29e